MPAVAFVNPVPNNFVSGAAAGQFTAIHDVTMFDSGGVGTRQFESRTDILGSDTVAQIATKIAAAVRTAANDQFGVTIPANAVVVPGYVRA